MANLLDQGESWLTETLKEHCAEDVEYVRGDDSVRLRAVVGSSETDVDDGQSVIRSRVQDFIVEASDLRLCDGPATPREGDLIRTGGGQCAPARTFRVMPMPGTREVWRHCDPSRRSIRIHARVVEEGI